MRLSVLFVLLFFISFVGAYQNTDIELANGVELNTTQFDSDGRVLFIWLPSERGLGEGYVPVALDLSALGYDVWSLNLHDSYVIPTGRDSLEEIEMYDLEVLLSKVESQGFEEVYLIASGRGVPMALELAYNWQTGNPQSRLLRGLFTFSPHLVKGRTEMGDDAEYLDIASYSNLPVYMLQTQYSTKFARSLEISGLLRQGGSQVYMRALKRTQGGFHMRPNDHLTKHDLEQRANLASMMESALGLLRSSPIPSPKPGYRSYKELAKTSSRGQIPQLHPWDGDPQPPELRLQDLNGQSFDLEDSRGEVILVNFWASWCRPCVKEIPSLSRLVDKMADQPFRVVTVNIGESEEDIREFLKTMQINFDILLDKDGNALRDWKVYAYPSNYLINQQGQITHSYRGALQWDAPHIVETIESQL